VTKGSRETLLFSFLLLAAAVVLFFRLTEFPLYFFCDEAAQGAEVNALLDSGKDRAGVTWPLFFRSHGGYQLSLSVYWLMPFQALLGESEFAVRASHVVASLLGVTAAALFVRRWFPANALWTAVPLVFYGAPFWYLHSRTGFEVVISASAWLICLALFPLLWRDATDELPGRHRPVPATRVGCWVGFLVAFAFCFYSYTPARGWAPLTLLALLLAWLPISYRQWRRTAALCALAGVIVAPFLITALLRPDVAFGRMHDLLPGNESLFTWQRMNGALHQFVTILNPQYWFSAQTRFESFERHMIPGLPLLPEFYLPLATIGFLHCILSFRTRAQARALLLLFPVGAFPAILFDVNPLRCIPVGLVYLLWTCAGLLAVVETMAHWIRSVRLQLIVLPALLLHLAWLVFHVFGTAVDSYSDYGFYGVQMGQREVFAWVRGNLDRYPLIHLTHAAFNGNEALVDFYLPVERRRQLPVTSADAPCVLERAEAAVWILRQERIAELDRSKCAVQRQTLHVFTDPRGEPLFAAVILTPLAGFDAALPASQ